MASQENAAKNCFGIPDAYAGFDIHQGPDDRFYASISAETWGALRERLDYEFSAQQLADGWSAWAGGDCPVAVGDLVERRYRYAPGYGRSAAPAGEFRWDHRGTEYDIIAYRVVSA